MQFLYFFRASRLFRCLTIRHTLLFFAAFHFFSILGCGTEHGQLLKSKLQNKSVITPVSSPLPIYENQEIEQLLIDYSCQTNNNHQGLKESTPQQEAEFETKGYVQDMLLWPEEKTGGWNISVCFEHDELFLNQHSPQVQTIVDSLSNTWSQFTDVQFSGFQSCREESKGIRILISDENPHTKGLGRQLDGVKNGMLLNFDFIQWGNIRNPKENTKKLLLEIMTIHEFGHALGFSHEHHRPNTPAEINITQGTYIGKKAKLYFSSNFFENIEQIRDNVFPKNLNLADFEASKNSGVKVQIVTDLDGLEMPVKEYECILRGSGGSTSIGEWDFFSVMNYCNPEGAGRKKLSAGDILAAREFYTTKASLNNSTAEGISNGEIITQTQHRGINIIDFQAISDGTIVNQCRLDSSVSIYDINAGVHSSYQPNEIRLCKLEDSHSLPITGLQLTKNNCPAGENWSKINVNLHSYWDNLGGIFYWQAGSLSDAWGTSQPTFLCVQKAQAPVNFPLRRLKNIWVTDKSCENNEDSSGISSTFYSSDSIEWISRLDINANLGRFPFFTWPENRKICARWGEE